MNAFGTEEKVWKKTARKYRELGRKNFLLKSPIIAMDLVRKRTRINPDKHKAMEITLKIGCPIECEYCPQARLTKAYGRRNFIHEISFETFKECLVKIPRDVMILFHGMGEPSFHRDFIRMLDYTHEKGYKIRVSTTLAGWRPGDIDRISSIPFDRFVIHIPADDGKMKIKINDNYLKVLERICGSGIKKLLWKCFGEPHQKIAPIVKRVREVTWPLMNRSNNIKIEGIPETKKHKGLIWCYWLKHNVLLPNGDVVLCCNDYGMKHILGNLLKQDYGSLFKGQEFRRVVAGLSNSASEILCRYCSESACQRNVLSPFGLFQLRYRG